MNEYELYVDLNSIYLAISNDNKQKALDLLGEILGNFDYEMNQGEWKGNIE